MKISHFLLVSFPAWGHVRPLCLVATRLVREQDNVVVTFLVVPHLLDRARAEVSRQFRDEPSQRFNALQRIRILSPCPLQHTELSGIVMIEIFAETYPVAYETLYQGKPIICPVTGVMFDTIPPPSVVIIDVFASPQLRATRAVSSDSVPILGFIVFGAGATIHLFAPESIGGMGDYGARIDAEMARTGLPVEEIGPKVYKRTEGKVIRVSGVPAMYDYEFFPQKLIFQDFLHTVMRDAYGSFRECDGVIAITSYIYEPVSLDAMNQWLSNMHKGLHVFGPLLPASEGGTNADVEAFLGEMLAQHGARSVFFVSFGTIFWPADAQYIDELIEALIEKKAPFILSHASPFAKISEELQNKVKLSGLGMLSSWCPQQFILNHPATGWFISHAGFNSATESLGSGIPLICWPFCADQPAISAQLAGNVNVAFELFEVRTGEAGLMPVHRIGRAPKGTREAAGIEIRQTIDLCRSDKGQELRRNAEQMKAKFAKAWEVDGVARKEMHEFLHKYT